MNKKIHFLTTSAIIAALYVTLTLVLAPISYGAIQCRISDALFILALFTPAAIPGFFVGCIIANILGGCVLWDIILGSIASLLAAFMNYKLRKKNFIIAMLPLPIIVSLITGSTIYFAYIYPGVPTFSLGLLLTTMGEVLIGELASTYIFGSVLFKICKNLPLFKNKELL